MKTTFVILALIITSVAMHAQQYSYDATGRLTKVIYDNGLETRYTYDRNGNIISVKTDIINSVTEDAKQSLAITASPTPASDRVVLRISDRNNERVDVSIVNSAGEVVTRMSRVVQNNECAIDVRPLPSGSYTLQCESAQLKGTVQILIRR